MPPCPVAGRVLEQPVELASLEAFEPGRLVAEILEHHPAEVEHAPAHRQPVGPVILDPPEPDALAQVEIIDDIGAAGDRILVGDGIERLAVAPAAREDGQILGEDQVQLRVGPFEEKTHQPVVHHLHPGHVAEILAQHRKALRPGDGFERMAYILGQHWRAVVEAGLDAQLEHHREAVVGQDHVLGQQAIDGKGFVPAGHTQRFEHQRAQPGGRHAPQRKGVE